MALTPMKSHWLLNYIQSFFFPTIFPKRLYYFCPTCTEIYIYNDSPECPSGALKWRKIGKSNVFGGVIVSPITPWPSWLRSNVVWPPSPPPANIYDPSFRSHFPLLLYHLGRPVIVDFFLKKKATFHNYNIFQYQLPLGEFGEGEWGGEQHPGPSPLKRVHCWSCT